MVVVVVVVVVCVCVCVCERERERERESACSPTHVLFRTHPSVTYTRMLLGR